MHALSGIVSARPPQELMKRVSGMCDIQRHHGPHERGVRVFPGACLGRNFTPFAGSSEVETADLPVDEQAQLCIAFNGILFNRACLAAALSGEAGREAAESDSSLVLKSYLAWGADCAKRLDGVFSFAIWNWKDNILYAARDRLGEKPFFYHASPRAELIFASEIKGLLKSGLVPKDLDLEAIYHYLHEKGFTSPRTPLAGVRALEPGHWLEYREGAVRTVQYWDVPLIREKVADEAIVFSRMKDLLREAVSERLLDKDAPSLLFSGGIDSSLLLAVMKMVTGKRVKTFTIVTGTPPANLALARTIAAQFGTEAIEFSITPRDVAENLNDLVWYLSTPSVASQLSYFGCKTAYEHGVSCILSGQASEVAFEVEWFSRLVMPAERFLPPPGPIPEKWRVFAADLGERALRKATAKRRMKLEQYAGLIHDYFKYKRGISSWYGSRSYPDTLAKLFASGVDRREWSSPADLYRALYQKSGSRKMNERTGYANLKAGWGPNAVTNYESIGAAFSLQLYLAFMDQQMIEYSRGISYKLQGKDLNEKYILRNLCKELVSPECATQQKYAFGLPFDEWMRADLWHIIEQTLSRESIERRGIFDYDRVAAMCGDFRGGGAGYHWVDIWAFVVLEIWLRLHCDPRTEDLAPPSGTWARGDLL